MPRKSLVGVLAAVSVMALLVGQVLSDGSAAKEQKYRRAEATAGAREAMAEPGEFHANLKPLAGVWSQTVRWRHSVDVPWEESKGTCANTWILGGRFLRQSVTGEKEESERYEGLGILGYNNARQQYTSVWMDNRHTSTVLGVGSCDPSGKVFTTISARVDPGTGGTKFQKSVRRIINNDKHVLEMFLLDPNGNEFKALEITFNRM